MKVKVEPKSILNLQNLRKKKRKNRERLTLTKMMKMVMKKEAKEQPKRRRRETVSTIHILECFNLLTNLGKKKAAVIYAPREQDNSYIRMLGNWSAGDWKQTVDYSIPVQ